MNINKQIEIDVSDAITERPFRFSVGEQCYSIYPPTLGKMQLLKNLYLSINVDERLFNANMSQELLQVCRNQKEVVCQIVAYSTFQSKAELLNADKVICRTRHFEQNLSIEDLATLLSLILSSDRTDEFIGYFGLDKERLKRQEIGRIKGDGSSVTFGGRSIYGLLIDFACQRYGWTLDYILWGISLVNLNMLMSDAITTVYLSDEERKQLSMTGGGVINADDPANNALLRELIRE